MIKRVINCNVVFSESGVTMTPLIAPAAGRQGEKNATIIKYSIKGLSITEEAQISYRVDALDGNGARHTGEVFVVDPGEKQELTIEYLVPDEVTSAGNVAELYVFITEEIAGETTQKEIIPKLTLSFDSVNTSGAEEAKEEIEENINAGIAQIIRLNDETKTAAEEVKLASKIVSEKAHEATNAAQKAQDVEVLATEAMNSAYSSKEEALTVGANVAVHYDLITEMYLHIQDIEYDLKNVENNVFNTVQDALIAQENAQTSASNAEAAKEEVYTLKQSIEDIVNTLEIVEDISPLIENIDDMGATLEEIGNQIFDYFYRDPSPSWTYSDYCFKQSYGYYFNADIEIEEGKEYTFKVLEKSGDPSLTEGKELQIDTGGVDYIYCGHLEQKKDGYLEVTFTSDRSYSGNVQIAVLSAEDTVDELDFGAVTLRSVSSVIDTIGDIDTALDGIISIQENLINGGGA